MLEYKFRIRIQESAMGGDLYIPEYMAIYKSDQQSKWWQLLFSWIYVAHWKEILKEGWDGPRAFGDFTSAGARYCHSEEFALHVIKQFKRRGYKNREKRKTIIDVSDEIVGDGK